MTLARRRDVIFMTELFQFALWFNPGKHVQAGLFSMNVAVRQTHEGYGGACHQGVHLKLPTLQLEPR